MSDTSNESRPDIGTPQLQSSLDDGSKVVIESQSGDYICIRIYPVNRAAKVSMFGATFVFDAYISEWVMIE